MDRVSTYTLAKRLEADVMRIVSTADMYALNSDEGRVLTALKHELIDARLEVRDYELAETRIEQGQLAQEARKRLESIKHGMLAASQFGVFGAVDIAQLSATIDRIESQLE